MLQFEEHHDDGGDVVVIMWAALLRLPPEGGQKGGDELDRSGGRPVCGKGKQGAVHMCTQRLHYITLPPRVEVERMRIAIAKRSRITTLAGELPLTKREGM